VPVNLEELSFQYMESEIGPILTLVDGFLVTPVEYLLYVFFFVPVTSLVYFTSLAAYFFTSCFKART